jgi:hypothetical protein
MGADRRRIGVVPCGVDVERFTPRGPVEARDPGRHRIVAACRLVERKGIAEVVAALAQVPDAELHVAGGPEREALAGDAERRRLRALAARLGVDDRLVLRGRVRRDGMGPLLRSADVVVCVRGTSRSALVPLEAMACGVPSWRPPWAGRSTPSSTARPACTSRRAIPARSPPRSATSSPIPAVVPRWGPPGGAARRSGSRSTASPPRRGTSTAAVVRHAAARGGVAREVTA